MVTAQKDPGAGCTARGSATTWMRGSDMASLNDDRFDRIDQTLDRVLGLLLDHGTQLGEVKADVREIRKQVVGIHDALTEHLTWHLGRA